MVIYLKENIKPTKSQLLDIERVLIQMKNDVLIINEKLSEFNTSKLNIFDESLQVYTKDIDECLSIVKENLGKIELDEGMRQKK